VWLALAMMVKTRVWLGGEGSAPRGVPWSRRLTARVRRCAARRPLLGSPAGVVSSSRAMRETLHDPGHPGTGGPPRRRVVAPARRRVDGTPAHVEPRRRRSPGDRGINTADMERLNATWRARHTVTLQAGMCLVGTISNLCTSHMSLSQTRKTTPAMTAGITAHCWTRHALWSFHVPLSRWAPPQRRGRPSRTLQRLSEHGARDHG
jgi:hypothetical protein